MNQELIENIWIKILQSWRDRKAVENAFSRAMEGGATCIMNVLNES